MRRFFSSRFFSLLSLSRLSSFRTMDFVAFQIKGGPENFALSPRSSTIVMAVPSFVKVQKVFPIRFERELRSERASTRRHSSENFERGKQEIRVRCVGRQTARSDPYERRKKRRMQRHST